MTFVSKTFNELTAGELYEIMKSRNEIFLLEQRIICQELDDMDYKCLHCWLEENGRVVAYLRVYEEESGTLKMGRVLTLTHGQGIGRTLMEKSFEAIERVYGKRKLCINAQIHAVGFYEKFGFVATSGEFLEEGVVHIAMELV